MRLLFFSIISINCTFDQSSPSTYIANVLEKRISRGTKRPDRYIIKIGNWNSNYSEEEISISKAKYNDIEVGEEINVYLNKGMLNIPWLTVGVNISSSNDDEYFYVDMVGTVFYSNKDTASDYSIYVLCNNDTVLNTLNKQSTFNIPLKLGKKYHLGFKKKGVRF